MNNASLREREIFDATIAEHGDFNRFAERAWYSVAVPVYNESSFRIGHSLQQAVPGWPGSSFSCGRQSRKIRVTRRQTESAHHKNPLPGGIAPFLRHH